jgi:pimeloyl-ACP methyl ester carboxylesterase
MQQGKLTAHDKLDRFIKNRSRRQFILLALALILLSWWGLLAARSGLVTRTLERDGVPMRYMVSDQAGQVPGVLVAHGFGVSQQIMRAYGYTLAHAGYGVMLWDFDGHGASRAPFLRDNDALQRDLDVAYGGLIAQPEIDPQRIALLGHSMGSGVVMRAAVDDPLRYQATVAVSPTGAAVSSKAPRNLLLQAGAWEGQYVANAQRLLAAAGGENQEFTSGRARSMVVVPNAEHILILFSHTAHQAAVDWLDASFGLDSHSSYRDVRALWFLLSLAGWMLLAIAAAPRRPASSIPATPTAHRTRRWLGLLSVPFMASLLVAVIDRVVPVSQLGGVVVGGAAGLWFFITGLGWLWICGWPPKPAWSDLGQGLALFLFLGLAVGAMTHFIALNWLLVPSRLVRWPVMALAYLPWLLAAGQMQQGASWAYRAGLWLGQSLLLSAGLIATVYLIPSLSVLILALPTIPLIFAVMTIAGGVIDHPWPYAIGNAMFFGWLMMAYFPFVG